jgi:hypothetical protein
MLNQGKSPTNPSETKDWFHQSTFALSPIAQGTVPRQCELTGVRLEKVSRFSGKLTMTGRGPQFCAGLLTLLEDSNTAIVTIGRICFD